jgi:hypothetical protein
LWQTFSVHRESSPKALSLCRVRNIGFDLFKIIIAKNTTQAGHTHFYSLSVKLGPSPASNRAWSNREQGGELSHSKWKFLKLNLRFKLRCLFDLAKVCGK